MLNWCRLIIWFHDHLLSDSVRNVKNVKICENGSNIDCLYETSSVWEKPWKPKFRVWPFGFGSVRVFKNRNRTEIRFPHIPAVSHVVLCGLLCVTVMGQYSSGWCLLQGKLSGRCSSQTVQKSVDMKSRMEDLIMGPMSARSEMIRRRAYGLLLQLL